uniref:Mitochondrial dicarboxylate carrier n=1 Tax=Panagrolaimus sp. ES5 TaxID=591445 RepID=A0AC34GT67_9BILA
MSKKEDRIGRWYFGGLAASGAACCTHPLDLLKVHLQTQQTGKITLPQTVVKVLETLPFYQKAALAGFSGAVGGFVGTPGDLVNVRMQNDMKLPSSERRNYKHALDGVIRIIREEGFSKIFNGATMATTRAIVMTIGQLSFYDQIKQTVIEKGYGNDTPLTHFFSSFSAASIATMVR